MLFQKTDLLKNSLNSFRKFIDSLTKRSMPARVIANRYVGFCVRESIASGKKKKDAISEYSSLCEKCFGRKTGFSRSNTRRKLRFHDACCRHKGLFQKALLAGWTISSILISKFKKYDELEYYMDFCIHEVLTERDLLVLLDEKSDILKISAKTKKKNQVLPDSAEKEENSGNIFSEDVFSDECRETKREFSGCCVSDDSFGSCLKEDAAGYVHELENMLGTDDLNRLLCMISLFFREICMKKSGQK